MKPLLRTLHEIMECDRTGKGDAETVLRIALREAFDAGCHATLDAIQRTPAAEHVTVRDLKIAFAKLEGRP